MDGDSSAKTMDKGASAYVDMYLTQHRILADFNQSPEKRRPRLQCHSRASRAQRRACRRKDDRHWHTSLQRGRCNRQAVQWYVILSTRDEVATDHTIADGAIGQIGEKVGGPFSSQGAIGKQFTTDGSIGGAIHEQLGKGENNTFQK